MLSVKLCVSGIPFDVERVRKVWRKLPWCLWESFVSDDKRLTDSVGVSA